VLGEPSIRKRAAEMQAWGEANDAGQNAAVLLERLAG
jgi:hypothetical protein